jgi:hypothetical protein
MLEFLFLTTANLGGGFILSSKIDNLIFLPPYFRYLAHFKQFLNTHYRTHYLLRNISTRGLSIYFNIYLLFLKKLIEQYYKSLYNTLIALNSFLKTFYSVLNLKKKSKPSHSLPSLPNPSIQTYLKCGK